MSVPGSIGTTREMTAEEMSGHMNEDYSYPSVVAKVTDAGDVNRGIKDVATARGVTASMVMENISADPHTNEGWQPDNAGNPNPYKVREA